MASVAVAMLARADALDALIENEPQVNSSARGCHAWKEVLSLNREEGITEVDPWGGSLIDRPTQVAIMRALGDLLRRARKASGLKMVELADQCGVSQSVLCRIELAQRRPTIDVLMEVCARLGIRVSDLFRAAEDAAVPLPLGDDRRGRFRELVGEPGSQPLPAGDGDI